ncbi:hypothetical protein BB560_000414 [Smittium megazygosporum]|uniref:Uncharacterized protein n=1 Tax=Smittium megazygosporum TaxID=133381 RepID=A0A2T9ZKD2_9FUNG|nr:hypothetical protein BB560_000414 [Smittium megazygosporum]
MESRRKVLEPLKFSSKEEQCPEEWINRYKLTLQKIKFEDYPDIEEFEIILIDLFNKAKFYYDRNLSMVKKIVKFKVSIIEEVKELKKLMVPKRQYGHEQLEIIKSETGFNSRKSEPAKKFTNIGCIEFNSFTPEQKVQKTLDLPMKSEIQTGKAKLLDLCRKVEEKQVSSLADDNVNITNCRVLVEIFGKYFWTMLDTGAACSVASKKLITELGLEPDVSLNRVLVTADGARHQVGETLSKLHIKVAWIEFEFKLKIMNSWENGLILGTD